MKREERGERGRGGMAAWARIPGCARGGLGVKTERQRGKQDGRAFTLMGTEVAGTVEPFTRMQKSAENIV